jgi:hypothetical protein
MTLLRRVRVNPLLALLVGLLTTILLLVPAGLDFVSSAEASSSQPTYAYDSTSAATSATLNAHGASLIASPGVRTAPGVVRLIPDRSLAAKAGDDVARLATKALGPGTNIGSHVAPQMAGRGWTERLIESTIARPARTVTTRDTRRIRGGGRMDDPATAYYSPRGGYVVRNDRTGDIVQISDRTDPNWIAPWD